jgi:hypothetical protein
MNAAPSVLMGQPRRLMTHTCLRFRRRIERRALWMGEDAARDLPNLPLEEALADVGLPLRRAG